MREIKFRAWAHASKVMFKPDSNNGAFHFVDGWVYDLPNTTLMQYTGLKDKTCKALDWWESDLFKIDGTWPVYVLEYNETAGAFGLRGIGGMWKSFPDTYQDYGDDSIHKIGNRFENPELMEGEV